MNAPLRQAPELRPIHADITRERWHAARRSVRSTIRGMAYAEGNARKADAEHIGATLRPFPREVQNALCRDGRDYAARDRAERIARLRRMIAERECGKARGNPWSQVYAAFRIAQELGRPFSRINAGEWLRTS